ncbi:hypothetical protein H4Q26_007571 [Puccinia striiformis f. sp. tritici PST-130]|nr:hypothetical protein H4Q26_007571 [Puccinia striiformis f. sp. tritici PST-130]
MDQPFSQASVGLKHPQLRNEIEVAIEKFTSLRSICNPPHIHDDPTFSEKALLQISMEETSFKGELMWALECRYLPTLQHQLTTLLRSLDPSGLQKEAESQLQLVSETQSGLERSISFINIAIAIACPEPIPPLHPVDDQHRQLLKTYSLSSLKSKYLAATHFASSLFAEANELLEQLKLSPDEFNGKTDTPSMQEKSLNYSLEEFERLVKVEGHMMPCGNHDETRKELVKLAIPISKLTKLFFSKLSRRVALDMLLFQILFTRAHMAARPATSQDFIQISMNSKSILSCFSTWNTHLVLAIGNFTTLAKSLDDDPL